MHRSATQDPVAVIVPARNEGRDIEATLESLSVQALRPVCIVVVVNNCTDDTGEVAREFSARPGVPPVYVLEMPGVNLLLKAGALNYGIRFLMTQNQGKWQLPAVQFRYLITMDGDTVLDGNFLSRAVAVAQADPRIGGVSAACLGKPGRGASQWQRMLMVMQRIEYARFALTRIRREVHTMSGAGSLYKVEALNGLLGTRRDVFTENPVSLVEDYETTLALKMLGWKITSNQHCTAWTDLMPTMRMLNTQRFRWIHGTIREWRRYGWCNPTRLSIMQVLAGLSGIAYSLACMAVGASVLVYHHGDLNFSYLAVGVFWSAYQGWVARTLGWKVVLFEMALLPEIAFNMLRNYWLLRSIAAAYLTRAAGTSWHLEEGK